MPNKKYGMNYEKLSLDDKRDKLGSKLMAIHNKISYTQINSS